MDDALGAVEGRDKVDRSRELEAHLRQEPVDRPGDLNRVRSGLPGYCKHDHRSRRGVTAGVEVAGKAFVLDAIDHVRDVAKVDWSAVLAASHDQVLVSFGLTNLAIGTQDQRRVFP